MSKQQHISKDIKQVRSTKANWVIRWVIATIAMMITASSLTVLFMTTQLGYKTKEEHERSMQWDPSGITTADKPKDVFTVAAPPEAMYWLDDDLYIDGDKLSDGFNAFNWGAKTKFLAYKNEYGQILTAFSTCQSCYDRGEITFSITEGLLHCSGCTTTQNPELFGTASWGGCKPIAVPPNYRRDSDGLAIVPKEVFLYAATMFDEWDRGNYETTFTDYLSD